MNYLLRVFLVTIAIGSIAGFAQQGAPSTAVKGQTLSEALAA